MRRMRKEVRVGLIGSMAVVAGLAGVLTFATAAGAKKTTTTTSTSTTSTTAAGGTTTTTVPCTPAPTSSGGSPLLNADPGTCLNGGTPIAVTGSGYDANSIGILLECNNDPSQPSVALPAPVSQTVPVSCTGIAIANAIPTKTGSFSATWNTIAGTTGPPCGQTGDLAKTCPADTSGGDAATDAAAYPCPPTAAQLAAGVSCTLAFGDEGGKTATVPISFVPAPTPTPPGTGGAATTTTVAGAATAASSTGTGTAATAAPTTAASSGSLAFTGPGTGLYIVGAAGLFMVLLGAAVLGLSGAPSSLALALRRRRRTE
jgi:hypothetical protein